MTSEESVQIIEEEDDRVEPARIPVPPPAGESPRIEDDEEERAEVEPVAGPSRRVEEYCDGDERFYFNFSPQMFERCQDSTRGSASREGPIFPFWLNLGSFLPDS